MTTSYLTKIITMRKECFDERAHNSGSVSAFSLFILLIFYFATFAIFVLNFFDIIKDDDIVKNYVEHAPIIHSTIIDTTNSTTMIPFR